MRTADAPGRDERVQRRGDRLRAQEHARATTVGIVVDAPMAPQAPRPQVVRRRPSRRARRERPPGDALRERSREELREERDDVDAQRHVAAGCDLDRGCRTSPAPTRRLGVDDRRRAPPSVGDSVLAPGPTGARRAPSAEPRSWLRSSRARASPSTTMRPSAGANSTMTAPTAGTSTSPRGPSTTNTSLPPVRKMSVTVPSSSPAAVLTWAPVTSCQYQLPAGRASGRPPPPGSGRAGAPPRRGRVARGSG